MVEGKKKVFDVAILVEHGSGPKFHRPLDLKA